MSLDSSRSLIKNTEYDNDAEFSFMMLMLILWHAQIGRQDIRFQHAIHFTRKYFKR